MRRILFWVLPLLGAVWPLLSPAAESGKAPDDIPSACTSAKQSAVRQEQIEGQPSESGASGIYHYHDSERDAEVWGVRSAPLPQDTPSTPPVLIMPEIKFPQPSSPRPPRSSNSLRP